MHKNKIGCCSDVDDGGDLFILAADTANKLFINIVRGCSINIIVSGPPQRLTSIKRVFKS
uniref:Uncharacterized protein n=1 Tax=Romanomermis culicivorax TaxID=13658 RepID=A0A915KX59_ROMCU